MIRLSICIPTYNRKEKVVVQVRKLLSQINTLNQELIEVLVSDNCSDDGTYDALLGVACHDDNVKIFFQPENRGLVGNLYFLFNNAVGEYVWFLSDDDQLKENSVPSVLELLNKTEKDFYLLNFDTDNNEKVYWSPVHDYIGLLSVQILKKSRFHLFYEGSSQTYNLCQPVAVSLYGLLYLNGMVSFDYSYLRHHVGDYSWKKDSMRVFSVYLLESIQMLKQYNKEKEYNRIIMQLKKMDIFCFNSLLYIIRKRDAHFIKSLIKEGLFIAVISNGLKITTKKIL